MKYLSLLIIILSALSLNAQWVYNATSTTGIQSSFNSATGSHSVAMGYGNFANGYATVALGRFNNDDSSSPSSYSKNNYAFVIGNGSSNSSRSNVFSVRFNGQLQLLGV